MRFLFVFIASVVSIAIMFLITRFIGYRQISELSMYDYINSITLGSIAADLAIASEWKEAAYCILAMLIYGIVTFAFSYISQKSLPARKFLIGPPILLMENGQIYKSALKKAHLDLDEFLSMCRIAGYFDPAKIDTVLLEPGGKISIIPKSFERPVTHDDLGIPAKREGLTLNIVTDGQIIYQNINKSGFNISLLYKELKKENLDLNDVFLATLDSENKLKIFKKD